MYDVSTKFVFKWYLYYFGSKGLIIQIMFSNGSIYTYFGSKGLILVCFAKLEGIVKSDQKLKFISFT
jgi:hypothetical protein